MTFLIAALVVSQVEPLALLVPQDAARIDELVQQLGSDEFTVREKATGELRKIGKPAEEALKKALESPDPEVKTRARTILDGMNAPAEAPRRAERGRPGLRGSSIQVQTVNGDSTYKITPGDGSDPITFTKDAGGRVKLEHPDGKGGTTSAEAESVEKFLVDHKDLAAKYGITEDGINYGGASTRFKGGAFNFGGRALELPRGFQFDFGNLLEDEDRFRAAGATFEKVSEALRAQFELPEGQGLVARTVPESSEAYAAGLRKSDVLLEVDGAAITTPQSVKDRLKKSSALVVLRKGKKETVAGAKRDF